MRMFAVCTYSFADNPTTLALFAYCFINGNLKLTAIFCDFYGRYDECSRKFGFCFLKKFKLFAACLKSNLSLK